ncbi:MAG: lysoplasmalogenase [Planctomycetes bacterium]|nr:lysoplasmalogenase [Planctomycetota bacterium]
MLIACLIALGSGVVATVWARWRGAMRLAGALKVGCSLGFVALACVRPWPDPGYAAWMVTGLCLSALGDGILLVRRPRALVVGAVAFALAHVAYVVAWVQLLDVSPGVLGAALGMLLGVIGVTYGTRERTGRMRWLVLGYGLVLGSSVVTAVALGLQAGGVLAGSLGVGAVLFLLSDLSVLRDRLLTPSLWNPTWGLPCYYAAQVCFALSVAQVSAQATLPL